MSSVSQSSGPSRAHVFSQPLHLTDYYRQQKEKEEAERQKEEERAQAEQASIPALQVTS
jgi:hypothetical protein